MTSMSSDSTPDRPSSPGAVDRPLVDEPLEPLDYVLLAYDGLLATEGPDAETPSGNLTPPLAKTVEQAEACLRGLEMLWPRAARGEGRSSVALHSPEDRRCGDYLLLDELARGGMGVVYRARHLALDRIVALKMILAGRLASSAEIRRFHAEARAAAKLQHPGIVPIYEIGEHQGQHYFTMALIEGPSLQERLKRGPLPPNEAAERMRQIADAVDYAHSRGVIHRDLKPHNVLLDADGSPKITDFGLAKRLGAESLAGLTATGDLLGTPQYMAPEQAVGGQAIEPRSDVYSLGALLYAMLTGGPPFRSEQLTELLRQLHEQEPPPPARLNAAVPRDLETICLKALQKRPADRYSTAAAFGQDLERYLRGEPILARRTGPVERLARWVQRQPAVAALIALVLIACALSLIGLAYRRQSLEWKRQAELQAELVAQRSQLAVQQSQLARRSAELADLAKASQLLSDANARATRRNPGWSWRTLETLAQARSLAPAQLDPVEIRSLIAQARTALDARPVKTLAEGIRIRGVAFSRDGRTLAVAQHRGTPHSTVFLYRTEDWQLEQTVSLNTAATNMAEFFQQLKKKGDVGSFQEGMASVALSDDGQWVAAGTRLGKVCLWRRGTNGAPQVFEAQPGMLISQVAFARDSRTLYAASNFNCQLYSWNLGEGWTAGRTWKSVDASFDLHPSQPWIATSHQTAQLLEATSERRRTEVNGAPLGPLCYWPDGRYLISGYKNWLRIYEVDAARVVKDFPGPLSANGDIDYSAPVLVPQRGAALIAGELNDVYLFNLASGRIELTLSGGGRENPPLATSPDGRWLAVTKDEGVEVYELRGADAHEVVALSPFPVDSIALSGDGRRLAYASRHLEDQVLRRTETGVLELDSTPRQVRRVQAQGQPAFDRFHPRHFRATECIAWDRSGRRLAIGSELIGLHWLEANQAQWPQQWQPNGVRTQRLQARELQFAEDARGLLIEEPDESAWSGRAARIAVDAKQPVVRIGVPLASRPTSLERIVVLARVRAERATLDRPQIDVRLLNVEGSQTRRFQLASEAEEYEWLRAGVLSAPFDRDRVELEFVADAATTASWRLEEIVLLPESRQTDSADNQKPVFRFVAFSPSGDRCYCALGDDALAGWDTATGEQTFYFRNRAATLLGGNGRIASLAVGEPWIVAGDMSGHLLRWDARTLEPLPPLGSASSLPLTAVAISSEGPWIACGSMDGALRVVDGRADGRAEGRTGEQVVQLEGHSSAVTSIVFDATGEQFWSGSRDGSVVWWRRVGGEWRLFSVLSEGGSAVKSLQYGAQEGRLALIREEEHAIQLWRTAALAE
ncbi:MAG: serine/threonine-protein kinase [Pirellulales bacterium]